MGRLIARVWIGGSSRGFKFMSQAAAELACQSWQENGVAADSLPPDPLQTQKRGSGDTGQLSSEHLECN